MTSFWIVVGLAAIVVLGLLYWWRRPVGWQDGENTTLEDEGPLLDTDLGASRWWSSWYADRFTQWLFNVKDWFENERWHGKNKK